LKDEISQKLGDLSDLKPLEEINDENLAGEEWKKDSMDFLEKVVGLPTAAADQLTVY
jgi:hypothetical protein